MNNPETYILKQNRFKRQLVDIFLGEKKQWFMKLPTGLEI